MFLQFVRSGVDECRAVMTQQSQISQGQLDITKSCVPKVQAAWIGKDAEEFAADVARKIVPAMVELIAACAGVDLNLGKATSIMDQADNQCMQDANGLGDLFGGILGGM